MTDLENIDDVHILKDTFCETGDLDYLETAIALTAEMISASSPTDIRKILQPLMASLLEMKSSATQPVLGPMSVTPPTVIQDPMSVTPPRVVHETVSETSPIVDNGAATSIMDELSVVQTLKESFLDTGDINDLDNAIVVTEEMISPSSPTDIKKILQPLMASDLETKSSATQPVQQPMLVTPMTPATQPVPEPMSVTSPIDMEVLSVVQTLKETFLDTGDFDYLDHAIALIEEIIEPSSPTDVKKILLPLLASLLAMKFEPASAALPFQEPVLVTSPTVDGSPANPMFTHRVPVSEMLKELSVARTLVRGYSKTGDPDYLHNARVHMDDLISIRSPNHEWQTLQAHLSRHLDTKSEPESATDSVQEPVSVASRTVMEDLRLVPTLLGVFLETLDSDYLDNAIALLEELIPASSPANNRKILQPLLASILQTKQLWALAVQPVREPLSVKSTTIMEDLKLVRVGRATFLETGHPDDLENVIAITKAIITTSSPTDVTRVFLPLLASLWDMRSEPESAPQPAQEPMISTSTTSAIQPVEERILVTPTIVDDCLAKTMTTNPVIASQLMEDLNAVQTLVETFRETGDVDYFDTAMAVILELIVANPSSEDLQALLANMLEIEPPTSLAGPGTEHAPTEGIDASFETVMSNTVPDNDEIADNWELVTALGDTFDRTGEIDYMDSAIGIAEDLIATIPDGERRRPRMQSYLSLLYYRRSIDGQDVGDLDNKLVGSEEARVGDLERAIAANSAALAETTTGSKYKAVTLYLQSQLVYRRFKLLGGTEDLQNAILGNEEAVNEIIANEEAVATADLNKQEMLIALGSMLSVRYELLGALEDIDNSIRVTAEAVAETLPNDPDRGDRLHNLSKRHFNRFERLGEMDNLEQAIKFISQALAATPPAPAKQADRLRHQSILAYRRFERLAVVDDLQNSILAVEEAVAIGPSTGPIELSYLEVLLFEKCKRLGALEDYDKAISVTTKSFAAIPADDPMRANRLDRLSHGHYSRYERSGQVGDLDAAILAAEEAVALTPFIHADMLNNQGALLTTSYDRVGNVADQHKSIVRANKAITQSASDDPPPIGRLVSFSGALFRRFEEQGNIEDLQSAIRRAEEALAMTSLDDPHRASILCNISILLRERHGVFGAREDHINAMQAAEDAVAAARNSPDPRMKAMALLEMSHMLGSRDDSFGWSGNTDESILMGEKALSASSSEFDIHASLLANLSGRFLRRYSSQGALGDLEKSIELAKRAVAACLPGELCRSYHLEILSAGYLQRYYRSNSVHDLVLVSEVVNEVLDATPSGPRHCLPLSTASSVSLSWFFQTGSRYYIDKAVWYCEQAVALAPARHVHRSGLLSNLSVLLRYRFNRFKEPRDLENGIQMAMEAVAVTGQDHPIGASSLMQLGNILDTRDTEYRAPTLDDIRGVTGGNPGQPSLMFPKCLDVRLETWNLLLLPPSERINAARSAAAILVRDSSWEHASSLLADAVRLLPTIAPQFLTRVDQEQTLSNVVGLASDTMSVALQAGSTAAHSLSLLELGRGIIMSFAIDCRSDLSDLRAQHPEYFNKLTTLRIEIDSPLLMIQDDSDGPNNVDARRRQDEDRRCRRLLAQEEIEQTLAYIHQLPGFEGFQRPPNPDDLMNMAVEGPIVIFNCNLLRSDAIIVTATAIRSLSLPGLVYSEIPDRISQFTRLVNGSLRTAAKRNIDMARALMWLWEVAVEPVLEELGLGATNEPEIDSKLPHIWWIGVGILARAPFHAAGDHSRGSTHNTLSRAISSYIPTIQALLYARQKKLALDTNPRLLLVAMPTTPETPAIVAVPATRGIPAIVGSPPIAATETAAPVPRIHATAAIHRIESTPGTPAKKFKPLKGALNEINQIVAVMQESLATVEVGYDPDSTAPAIILDSPSVSLVLQKLPAYQVIHFACHGVSDAKSPSDSHLVLLGDRSSEPGKLTVDAIASMNIEKAQIAYLSACSTADNASIDLADESIHIATGFLLAGFSHVLAALWPANDEACRQVAVDFYRRLFNKDSRGEAGHRAVSTAFHQSVKKLRDNNLGQPIKWACFIHTGA